MNSFDTLLSQSIVLFVLVPLVAFLATLFWQNKQEKAIAGIVQFTKMVYIITSLGYAVLWFVNGFSPVNAHLVTLYETEHFVFAIQFYYDQVTAVFSVTGAVLFFLVATFSRYYMHRDEGFKRFFNTILFFALGYNLIIFSGNFETLFVGWEIIGLSSFLLIAFYRTRYLPVKNAFKTLSNYRVSDVALILAMWMMHHLTHQNITFSQLDVARNTGLLAGNETMAMVIVIMIMLAATVKSAQFPFTSWLPRAMEGPTSSSAIFYGSLSVHIGVFVLLRTWPFWQDMLWAKIAIITIGVITGLIATATGRVQPTVKTQIAYSSAAQIGIIFIEVALGFHVLALIHFAGNAFLRTYQLLVSPSVLNYLVHHQYFHYHAPQDKPVSKLRAALYVLSVKEWNLDTMLKRFLWDPFKWAGRQLGFMKSGAVLALMFIAGIGGAVIAAFKPAFIAGQESIAAGCLLFIATAIILFVFAYRGSALKGWTYLVLSHVFIVAGISLNADHVNGTEIIYYAAGMMVAFFLGYYCLHSTKSVDNDAELDKYHGNVYEQKRNALMFLLAAIGLLGFPITTAFIGIDVLFTYIERDQFVLITLLAVSFIFIELAAIRIFIRIYLGLHKKNYHPVAFRSS